MWMQFSEQARDLVAAAERQAAARGHGEVDTGHFLLAALEDGTSTAGRILAGMPLRTDELERQVEALMVVREQEHSAAMRTLTAEGKRMIDLAYEEARSCNAESVGADHLLLGLAAVKNGAAARALACQGVDENLIGEAARRLRRTDLGHGDGG